MHRFDKLTEGLLAQTVEKGYLPGFGNKEGKLNDKLYKDLLATPLGAIATIGAELQAFSDIADRYGFNVRTQPDVLAWAFNSKDLQSWEKFLKEKQAKGQKTFDTSRQGMSSWIATHLSYLQQSLGGAAKTPMGSAPPPGSQAPSNPAPPSKPQAPTRSKPPSPRVILPTFD